MENVENVKKILERNDYQITAFVTDNGCMVIYPARVEVPTCQRIRVQYEYTEKGLRTVIIMEDGKVYRDILYPCPTYAQRVMMFSHVISRCIYTNYSVSLIVFMKEDEEVDEDKFYESCVNNAASKECLILEDKLRPIIIDCLFNGFTSEHEESAKKANVISGLKAIKNMLTGKIKLEELNAPKEKENSVGG